MRDFAEVVHGADALQFDALVERHCAAQALASPGELDGAALEAIGEESLELALALTGQPFPQDPMEQLLHAVEAVFRSWNDERARHYRRLNGIDDAMGTAVTVQAMVFGNGGSTSGAGVGFTRDPATGENQLYLDFLFNAQGEDVVSGRHAGQESASLTLRLPRLATELARIRAALEGEFRDMQDFEFTVERGKLHLLQTRSGKRTPWCALHIAVDMVSERLITLAEALRRLKVIALERLERLHLAGEAGVEPLATAIPASLGAASGSIVFNSSRAAELAARGETVILVRPDMSTADLEDIARGRGGASARQGLSRQLPDAARPATGVELHDRRSSTAGGGCHHPRCRQRASPPRSIAAGARTAAGRDRSSEEVARIGPTRSDFGRELVPIGSLTSRRGALQDLTSIDAPATKRTERAVTAYQAPSSLRSPFPHSHGAAVHSKSRRGLVGVTQPYGAAPHAIRRSTSCSAASQSPSSLPG